MDILDDADLKRAGQAFCVGEDLYGVSVTQLKERLTILEAEQARIAREIDKKTKDLSSAETFFGKT
ncbi:MAG: hypothetical protein COB56_06425 [Robiginitomaculum sp.]|nr:MAG: hypothetical protein COB56_06425 [Robiginitomaculum sp.]